MPLSAKRFVSSPVIMSQNKAGTCTRAAKASSQIIPYWFSTFPLKSRLLVTDKISLDLLFVALGNLPTKPLRDCLLIQFVPRDG